MISILKNFRKFRNLTSLYVLSVTLGLASCGEQFQGNFIGTARASRTDCNITPNASFDIVVASAISGNRARLRVLQMTPQTEDNCTNCAAQRFADFFTGVPLRVSITDNERFYAIDEKDTIYRVPDRNNLSLDNISPEGRFSTSVDRFDYDIVTSRGSFNVSRDVINNFVVERQTKLKNDQNGAFEDCTYEFVADELRLQKR